MRKKTKEIILATKLRKKGFSYTEIQNEVPVSKSSLSHWLSHIKLTTKQIERLKLKSKANQHLGALANKQNRITRTRKIKKQARNDIKHVSKNELFYLGIMLYWAEGAKQKSHNPGQGVLFSNSDPAMIRVYLKWLLEIVKIPENRINFSIYSHDNIKHKEKKVVDYWSNTTGFSKAKFGKIYYKKDKKKKYRRNQGKNYFGLLRVEVKRSTDLNRKITGWTEGICKQCGVV